MPRHFAAFVVLASTVALGSEPAAAQAPVAVARQASASAGSVHGMVRDEVGQPVGGVSVVAVGTTLLASRSDERGRFSLALPPGEYVLRATRDGFVSTYREPIRVQTNVPIERNITIVRRGVTPSGRPIAAAGLGLAGLTGINRPPELVDDEKLDHAHDEAAWRLRHLARSVLRDEGAGAVGAPQPSGRFTPYATVLETLATESARTAGGWLSGTDFTGQVNFLTVGSVTPSSGWAPTAFPRGIAYASVSAPVGSAGDWVVRGATSAADLSSWVLLGEYRARPDRPHTFRVGMSYSAQLYPNDRTSASRAPLAEGARNVGGLYAFDRWHARRSLEFEYGARLDRYDYLNASELLSPRLGLRLAVLPATWIRLRASERMVAPGADEFLPPMSAVMWLPPERTFSTLAPGAPFHAERVAHFEAGVERLLGRSSSAPLLSVRRFRQAATDQIVALFADDHGADAGHYLVAAPGNADIKGWGVRLTGQFLPHVDGVVDYSISQTEWSDGPDAAAVAAVAPDVVRLGAERLHDLTAGIDATIPGSATRVTATYRFTSTWSVRDAGTERLSGGRFDVRVYQALPFRPLGRSRLEALFAVRNLFRDLRDTASLYDELLTVHPPLRLMGGVQVRF